MVNLTSVTNILSQHDYSYEGFGNRQSHTENIGGVYTGYRYFYDNLKRLIQVSDSNPAHYEEYAYDPLGNRVQKTVDAANPVVTMYSYNAANSSLRRGAAAQQAPCCKGLCTTPTGA